MIIILLSILLMTFVLTIILVAYLKFLKEDKNKDIIHYIKFRDPGIENSNLDEMIDYFKENDSINYKL